MHSEGGEVGFVGDRSSGDPSVATQVGGDDVVAGVGEGRHHLSPAIGELREAVEQQEAGPAGLPVSGLQHMHAQAVQTLDEARADARGKNGSVKRQ